MSMVIFAALFLGFAHADQSRQFTIPITKITGRYFLQDPIAKAACRVQVQRQWDNSVLVTIFTMRDNGDSDESNARNLSWYLNRSVSFDPSKLAAGWSDVREVGEEIEEHLSFDGSFFEIVDYDQTPSDESVRTYQIGTDPSFRNVKMIIIRDYIGPVIRHDRQFGEIICSIVSS